MPHLLGSFIAQLVVPPLPALSNGPQQLLGRISLRHASRHSAQCLTVSGQLKGTDTVVRRFVPMCHATDTDHHTLARMHTRERTHKLHFEARPSTTYSRVF